MAPRKRKEFNILDLFHAPTFFTTLIIGLILVYFITPLPEIIVKYPTPSSSESLVYKDKANNCYKYDVKKVSCPIDQSKISKIPIQDKNNVSIMNLFH